MSDYVEGYVYDVDSLEIAQGIKGTRDEVKEVFHNNFDLGFFDLSFDNSDLIETNETQYFTLNNGFQ